MAYNNYKELADMLIDTMIEERGLYETVIFLFGIGLTVDDLVELEFDKLDVTKWYEDYKQTNFF